MSMLKWTFKVVNKDLTRYIFPKLCTLAVYQIIIQQNSSKWLSIYYPTNGWCSMVFVVYKFLYYALMQNWL